MLRAALNTAVVMSIAASTTVLSVVLAG